MQKGRQTKAIKETVHKIIHSASLLISPSAVALSHGILMAMKHGKSSVLVGANDGAEVMLNIASVALSGMVPLKSSMVMPRTNRVDDDDGNEDG